VAAASATDLCGILAPGGAPSAAAGLPAHDLEALTNAAVADDAIYPATADSPAFWLYT